MRSGSHFSPRLWVFAPLAGMMLGGAWIDRAAAAGHTVTSGTIVYPGSYGASDSVTLSGATTVLQIQNGSPTLTGKIIANTGATVDNSGTIHTSGTNNRGVEGDTGTATVINRAGGTITSDNATGVLFYNGGKVTNDGSGALIKGYVRGVGIQGAAGTVINTGGGRIESLTDGAIYMDSSGSVTNGADSTIIGYGSGLDIYGTLTLDNHGTITGTHAYGAIADDGSVTNSGAGASLSGHISGVMFASDLGSVTNEDGATISGETAIDLEYGGDVDNSGGAQITGTDTGIVVWDTGTVTNSGAGSLIHGDNLGIDLAPYDTAGPFTVDNKAGARTEGGYAGVRFLGMDGDSTIYDVGTLTNDGVDSTITAYSYGVLFDDGALGDVVNTDHAAIESTHGSAVALYSGGSVDNRGGASLTGAVCGIYSLAAVTVTNDGSGSSIAGTACQGVYALGDGSSVTNSGGASIAGSEGVWLNGDNGTVTNTGAGSIITGTSGHGVAMGSGAVTNSDGAVISGGVSFDDDGTVTNTGGATVGGGIGFGGDGTVTNTGSSITGGIHADGGGTVTNSGDASIAGGISFGDTVTVTNTGSSITGSVYTILLGEGGTVTNTGGGTISGGDIGVYLYDGGGTVTNGVGSTISGTTGIHAFGDTTVVNAGTINGNVWLEDGAENHVTLYSGSKITGDLYIGSNSASTLTLDGDGDQLYSAAVTNTTVFSSMVIKKGSGTWTIDKAIDAQVFNIDAGHLIIGVHGDGAVTATVYANPGSVISGSGTLYGNLITDHATVAPGNSPGTLTIVGGYLQDPSTTYAFELDRDTGVADKLVVKESSVGAGDGNATLQAGTKLEVTQLGTGLVQLGTRYTVLAADNSLTGTFSVTGNLSVSAFLSLAAEYDTHNAYLTVTQTRSLDAAAVTPNQHATAGALQAGPSGNAAFRAVTALPDDATARNALDQLSGVTYAEMQTGLLQSDEALRDAALGRLRHALCGRTGGCSTDTSLWARGYGEVLHGADGDTYTSGFSVGQDVGGLFDGSGYAGLFVDIGRTSLTGAASSDTGVGAYGGVDLGGLMLRGGASLSGHLVAAHRAIAFPGYDTTLAADYAAIGTAIFGEAAYRLGSGPIGIEPFVQFSAAGIRASGFDEGAGGLGGQAADASLAATETGVRVSYATDAMSIAGVVGWKHVLAGTGGTADLRFAGGPDFTVAGAPVAGDSALAGLTLDLALSEAAHLTFGYDGSFAPTGSRQSATAQLQVRF